MARERALHAMGMGENLKAVLACDRDQRHAGGVRHAHGERRGAETATIIGAPIAADFCTISTETRLVSTIMPWRGVAPSCASAPASLSSAL